MADSLNALNLQASHAISGITTTDAKLQTLISKVGDDNTVAVDLETLRSLRVRVNSDATVIQNLWNRLEQTIR